jgi:hypothetical protein
MDVKVRKGAVTDATSASLPLVKLDGETISAPTQNYAEGYTPVNADVVLVLVQGSGRFLIGHKQ